MRSNRSRNAVLRRRAGRPLSGREARRHAGRRREVPDRGGGRWVRHGRRLADNLDFRGSVKTVAGAAAFITGQTTTRAGAGHRSPYRLMPHGGLSIDDFGVGAADGVA